VRITLITGGVRSGKSRFALDMASAAGGKDVTFIATAVVADDEMRRRAAKHRAERPAGWRTIEAARNAPDAVGNAVTDVILLDCLTNLVSNAIVAAQPEGEQAALAAAARAVDGLHANAADRDGELIIVTNEVGSGVVPPYELGRWFRDAAGHANQLVARSAAEVYLLVAGIAMRISQ
jgi:adenosylcobinamide kinase/adenosylcobinamide-phosphate guanylyltransferase